VQVLAAIVNRLPATGAADDNLGNARIQLRDSRGSVIYQWGVYAPAAQQQALVIRPLSHPLSSWQLAYYAPELAASRGQLRWLTLAVLLAVAAVLAALAYYLYREHTREVRNAQQRVNFVNQVSHELKTPLTNIRMYAELLDDQLPDADDDKSRRYLDVIVSESQRLSRLITNVLNFAGLQKQRLQLHKRRGSVDDVINTALVAFRPLLHGKGVTIHFDAAAPAPVWLDSDVLEQILNNLLSNVEKYAAASARLDISSWLQGDYAYIRLRDYGPGIAKREREKIFRPFYRISSQLADGITGTGIGLTITRELARLHGGELQLLPDKPAPGACFQVSLYIAKPEDRE
jgi:signal transduction histidine kinase